MENFFVAWADIKAFCKKIFWYKDNQVVSMSSFVDSIPLCVWTTGKAGGKNLLGTTFKNDDWKLEQHFGSVYFTICKKYQFEDYQFENSLQIQA